MKKQSYQRILAVLISLMILLTAGMCIIGAGLLQTREDSRRLPRIRVIC